MIKLIWDCFDDNDNNRKSQLQAKPATLVCKYIYKAPLGKTHIGWLFIVSSAVVIPVSLLKLLKFVG